MANNVVEAKLALIVDEFNKNSREAASAVRELTKQMKGDFGQQGRAAKEAANEHDSLLTKFKEFRGEQVQQGRMARFYAGELMSIIPAADGAKSAIQGVLGVVIEGAAGGMSFGLAFEVAKLAIETFVGVMEESKKRAEAHAATIREATTAFEKYEAAVHNASETEKTFLEVTKKPREELSKKQNELRDLEEQLSKLEAQQRKVLADPNAVVDTASLGTAAIARADANSAKLRSRISELRNEIDIARALKEEADRNLAGARAGDAINKATVQEADKADARSELALQNYAKQLQVEEELDQEASRRADANLAADTKKREELLDLELKNYARSLEVESQMDEEASRRADAHLAADNLRRQHMMQQSLEEMGRLAETAGNAFGTMFGEMISGSKSASQAFAQMAQQMIQMIMQIAIKSVTASAVKAAGEAASSQAGIPLIGPVLAISAMGAMLSAVMGLLGNLGSAEGGWDLPGGGPFPAVLHANEMVLPAKYANVIRGMAEGDVRGGGGNVYIGSIQAWDGPSAEKSILALKARLERNKRWR